MTPDETIRFARTFFWASCVLVVGCLALVPLTWPIEIYRKSHPWGLTLLELAAWFAFTAWLCRRPPYHGLLTMLAGLPVGLIVHWANGEAVDAQVPFPIALGALVFTAGGLLIMLVSHISTDTQFRRPYWEEAMPGLVLAIAGVVAAIVLATQLPDPPPAYIPAAVPAEGA